eukprot:TRINITY_DN11044_c0_g1_i1.p1 TRINITY_DN11044_c0_g1~~TRINITY_DN11044_c0_g1_i1.p1  ORF type:complete len:278 (+),score=45.56 TRINITY_DN11044_c0_g1_i1:100-933(+)
MFFNETDEEETKQIMKPVQLCFSEDWEEPARIANSKHRRPHTTSGYLKPKFTKHVNLIPKPKKYDAFRATTLGVGKRQGRDAENELEAHKKSMWSSEATLGTIPRRVRFGKDHVFAQKALVDRFYNHTKVTDLSRIAEKSRTGTALSMNTLPRFKELKPSKIGPGSYENVPKWKRSHFTADPAFMKSSRSVPNLPSPNRSQSLLMSTANSSISNFLGGLNQSVFNNSMDNSELDSSFSAMSLSKAKSLDSCSSLQNRPKTSTSHHPIRLKSGFRTYS